MVHFHNRRRWAVWNLAIFSLLPLPLWGHAVLLSAAPAANQAVSGPDVLFNLQFNSRIDAKRSRLTIVGADGQQQSLQIEAQRSADTLQTEAKGLRQGSYVLRWQVLAADGHITRGEFPFRVQ
jgi:methionine-rich copper-binding protein CopC